MTILCGTEQVDKETTHKFNTGKKRYIYFDDTYEYLFKNKTHKVFVSFVKVK